MTEAKHKRPYVAWFHLYEIPRMGKSMTDQWLSEFMGREKWGVSVNGSGVSFSGDENILKLASNDSRTSL